MKKIICLIILLFTAILINVDAEDNTLTLNFDSRSQTLQIMANTDNSFGQAVTVVIVPQGTDPSILEINDSFCVDIFNTGENGVVEGSITLPAILTGGKYTVHLFPFGGSAEDFMYINKADATAMLGAINSARTDTAIENVFINNYDKIGIDDAVFQSVGSIDIARLFNLNRKVGDYTDFDDFYEDYRLAEVTALIRAGKPVDALLLKYQSYLNIDYDRDYNSLPAAAKSCLAGLLRAADTSKKISEQYGVLKILALSQIATDWIELKKVLTQNEDIWKPDKTYFNKLVLSDKVYKELFDKKTELTGEEILRDRFYAISRTLYTQEQEQKEKSNYTGGGGGGGTITAPPQLSAPATTRRFNDMTNHWANSEVEKLVKKGILSGYPDNTFRPDAKITRAEFITILIKAFPQNVAYTTSFVDVPEGAWYEQYLATAQAAGIVIGDAEKRAFPDLPISRQDAAVMLKRVLSIYGLNFSVGAETFSDNESISAYAKEAVYSLVSSGIISGMGDGTFDPKGETTRAQAAILLGRAMEKSGGVK